MLTHPTLAAAFVLGLATACLAQDKAAPKPAELEVLKASVGVWDAQIEVWPQGPDAPSIKFKGVETNRAFGEHWIASDFVFEYQGQTMKLHSIVGYDLDQKKLVGKVIDHGPYAATMTGQYDAASKTVTWVTKAKHANGKPMVQRTTVTHKSADERVLVLRMPNAEKDGHTKFMQIKFVRRK